MSRDPAGEAAVPMKTVLIVEDTALFREPIEAVLRAEGYRVLTASNGAEGLAAMSAGPPDAVVLDLGLPVMDGLTMLARMRQSPGLANVPVLVVSAVTDREKVVEAMRLGLAGYMIKSQFSLKVLLQRLRETTGAVEGGHQAAEQPTPKAARNVHGPAPGAARAPKAPEVPPLDLSGGVKGLKPLITRSDLLAKVDGSAQLQALSPTVAQVLKLTASEHTSIEVVSRAIARDQAIALKILKLANSAVYNRGGPVDSVHKAVVHIGLERIRQTVLNIAVIDRFTSAAFQGPLDTLQFWEHAIATGIIAAELAHTRSEKEADSAFTTGLLHDAGRIIFAEQLGPLYVQVLQAAQALGVPLEQAEARLLLMNHADVMDRVLHAWSFAKDLVNPIVHHHLAPGSLRSAAPKQVEETLRLGLADRLAHAMVLGSSGNETIYPIDEHCQALKIEPDVIERVEEMARRETDDVKVSMLSHSSAASWPHRRDQLRTTLKGPFRPLFVAAEPRADAYRIFTSTLADPASDEPPTIAVVHLSAPRDSAPISQRLVEAEQDRGVSALPAIVLSPTGKLALTGPAAARRVQPLPTPFAPTAFLDAVNALLSERAAKAA